MAYGSNSEHPLGFDPPIDEETGELVGAGMAALASHLTRFE